MISRKKLNRMFVLFLVVLILTGCQGASTELIPTSTSALPAKSPPSEKPSVTSAPTDTPMPTSAPTSTPPHTEKPTQTPIPTETPVPTPSLTVLNLVAPEDVIKLWNSWDGKYVLYAHRDAGIQVFDDLEGMVFFIALINVSMDDVMGDAVSFMNAGGVEMSFSIQNNVNIYKSQLLEDPTYIGFMVPEVAAEYNLEENASLVRLEFEPAD